MPFSFLRCFWLSFPPTALLPSLALRPLARLQSFDLLAVLTFDHLAVPLFASSCSFLIIPSSPFYLLLLPAARHHFSSTFSCQPPRDLCCLAFATALEALDRFLRLVCSSNRGLVLLIQWTYLNLNHQSNQLRRHTRAALLSPLAYSSSHTPASSIK